jgi:hypothetical protein
VFPDGYLDQLEEDDAVMDDVAEGSRCRGLRGRSGNIWLSAGSPS